jgi:hypothetical protein
MQKLITTCQILAAVFAASVAATALLIGVAGAFGRHPWSDERIGSSVHGGQFTAVQPLGVKAGSILLTR